MVQQEQNISKQTINNRDKNKIWGRGQPVGDTEDSCQAVLSQVEASPALFPGG